MVVVGIENPAQNDASGPRHARVTLTRYLRALQAAPNMWWWWGGVVEMEG